MTTTRSEDERFMRRALALARRGGTGVSPNPWVGCVLVKGGRVIAEGWHARFGGPHAEPTALARAGKRARGATAYVNLEPCCHEAKKTPPCVPALAAAGIRRVVAGMPDPNPLVNGRGLRRLASAGVRTGPWVLRGECEALNRPFSVRVRKGRPYVILKAAASLDGRIQAASGASKWITDPAARAEGHRLRAASDAVLVGSGTVLADDPSLTSHGRGRDPLRVILDSRLRTLSARRRVLRRSGPTLFMTSRSPSGASSLRWLVPGERPDWRSLAGACAIRVPRKGGKLDLRRALRLLLDMRVGTVLVEGGSRVLTSFLDEGLADELRLFLAPKLIGGAKALSFYEGRGASTPDRALPLRGLKVRRLGPDIAIRGFIGD